MPWQSKQQTAASKKERVDHGDFILLSDSVHTLSPPYTADMLIAIMLLLPYFKAPPMLMVQTHSWGGK
jgi:hypothetical protein